MYNKLLTHKIALSALAGIAVFLAFPCFYIVPTILLFPGIFNFVTSRASSWSKAILYGYVTAFFVMFGGFYWVTYVIHEFGNIPWIFSGGLFLGFCLIGAVNFPLYALAHHALAQWLPLEDLESPWPELWYSLALPCLFALIEFLVPKLFPWYIGHCLYWIPQLTQLSEITGSIVLSLLLFSTGSALGFWWLRRREGIAASPILWVTPGVLWILCLGFSLLRISQGLPERKIQVALVQGNVGNLDRVKTRHGDVSRTQHVMDLYYRLTEDAIRKQKPDLIVWPETAMPFELEADNRPYPAKVNQWVAKWNVPLITGAYSVSPFDYKQVYNSAILMEPLGTFIRKDRYYKNILLAFGEYMPFGEWFPSLYEHFPEVSNFARGQTQNAFALKDGTRLGVTVCYEAIVPDFYRRVVANEVHAVVNLTNDSWFGPTSEPYLHAALTPFRAIESRVPLIRVTNTGTSFTVDALGRMSTKTPVYDEAYLVNEVHLPKDPPRTFYVRFGNWFVGVMALILGSLIFFIRKKTHASVSV